MAALMVRQVHAVVSGALSAAMRWDWLATNPARGAVRPRQAPPQPGHESRTTLGLTAAGAMAM
jgi:integrase